MSLSDKALEDLLKEYLCAVIDNNEGKKAEIKRSLQTEKLIQEQWGKVAQWSLAFGKLNTLAHIEGRKLWVSEIKDPEIREFYETGPHP
jgi:hypothetical protein